MLRRRWLIVLLAVIAAPRMSYADRADVQACLARQPKIAVPACTRLIAKGDYRGMKLARIYHARAELHAVQGDDTAALDDLKNAYSELPGTAYLFAARGDAYARLKRYPEAIDNYSAALLKDPSMSELHLKRGQSYSNIGAHELALKDFEAAVAADAKDAEALSQRGSMLLLLGRTERALADFEKASTIAPPSRRAYIAWLRDGARDKRAGRRPAELEPPRWDPPADAPALARVCDLAAASSDDLDRPAEIPPVATSDIQSASAVAACRNAADANPANRRLVMQLARALHAGGDFEAARYHYGRAAERGSLVAMNNLAMLLAGGLGGSPAIETSFRWLRRAAVLGLPVAMHNLGEVFAHGRGVQRDPIAARNWFLDAAELGHAPAQARLDEFEKPAPVPASGAAAVPASGTVDVTTMIEAGYADLGRNDLAAAEAKCKEALALTPRAPAVYALCGNVANLKGERERAIEYTTKGIEVDRGFARNYSVRGVVLRDKGEYDKALDDFRVTLLLAPAYALGYYHRGYLHFLREQYQLAIADYSKAIEHEPGDSRFYRERGIAHYDSRDYDRAIADLSQAIARNSQDARSLRNRGLALFRKGEWGLAHADAARAIDLDPNDAHAYSLRGIAAYEKGNLDPAMADYDKAIELDPKIAQTYVNRGQIHFDRGNFERAIEEHRKALAVDQVSVNALVGYGHARYMQKNYGDATWAYGQAIKLDPSNWAAYGGRGRVRLAKGETSAAFLDFDKVIELRPNEPSSYRGRADAYDYVGNADKGRADRAKAALLQKERDAAIGSAPAPQSATVPSTASPAADPEAESKWYKTVDTIGTALNQLVAHHVDAPDERWLVDRAIRRIAGAGARPPGETDPTVVRALKALETWSATRASNPYGAIQILGEVLDWARIRPGAASERQLLIAAVEGMSAGLGSSARLVPLAPFNLPSSVLGEPSAPPQPAVNVVTRGNAVLIRITRLEDGMMKDLAQQAARSISSLGNRFAGIVLDLRAAKRVGDDELGLSVEVVEAFLGEGLIATTRGRDLAQCTVKRARPDRVVSKAPVAVLIGPETSGGAEVIAAALQDHRRASLIGTETGGMASTYMGVFLGEGTELRFTRVRVSGPAGQPLDARPISPDRRIVGSPSDELKLRDPQLDAALEHLAKGRRP